MAQPVYQAEGAAQLRRTLRKAGDDLQDLRAAHSQAAGIAARAASPLAPQVTGRLRGTIRAAGTKTAAIVRAGYARVPYAGPIHWGWPARNLEPRRFLTVGAQNSEPTWLRVYEQAIDTALSKIEGAHP